MRLGNIGHLVTQPTVLCSEHLLLHDLSRVKQSSDPSSEVPNHDWYRIVRLTISRKGGTVFKTISTW